MNTRTALHPARYIVLAATVLLALAVWSPEVPAATALPDGAELLQQIDRNLNPESFEMYRKLINIEPDGKKKEFVLYSVKDGRDKVLALFLSPSSDQGRSTLRLGDNMWLYIPNVGKPIRITSLQSVTGGVFNNSDILSLDYSDEYDVTGVTQQGQDYVLDLKAKNKTVAYDKLKMWVDGELTLPTKIEAFAATGLLIKTLYYKEVKTFEDGRVRPSVLETDSPLYKGYTSVIIWAKVTPRTFDDEVFTLNFMPRVNELR